MKIIAIVFLLIPLFAEGSEHGELSADVSIKIEAATESDFLLLRIENSSKREVSISIANVGDQLFLPMGKYPILVKHRKFELYLEEPVVKGFFNTIESVKLPSPGHLDCLYLYPGYNQERLYRIFDRGRKVQYTVTP